MTAIQRMAVTVCAVAAIASGGARAASLPQACVDMLRYTGAPTYAVSQDGEETLCRTGYVLSHNPKHRVADWVLEVLTLARIKGEADRDHSSFKADPDLQSPGRSELKDYARSGFDRGHMAPAGDMKWDQGAMDESFYLSNMAPQVGIGFNRGIWRELESYVRDLVYDREPIVIFTGPIYSGSDKKLVAKTRDGTKRTTDVTVPAFFYKIVYDPDRKRAIAFKLPNKKVPGGRDELKRYRVTIDQIEDDTGLDFLVALSRRDQRRIERIRSEWWRSYAP